MAIRTVAQAAADIRLSDAKANQDFEHIRRQLIQKATRLEADLAITVPVTVDQNSLRSAVASLSRLTIPTIVVPITANTDKVLADIIALTALDAVVEISVTANVEAAEGEISGLEGTETVIEIPVVVNAEEALREIIALTEIDAVIRIPVEVERPKASEIPVSEFPSGPTTLSLQADVADARTQIDAFIRALPPVVLRVLPDTDQFLTGVTTIAAAAEPVHVRVLPDTDAVPAAIAKIDLPPLEVPVTAAAVGPGIEVSPGLARFRAEMDQLKEEGVLLRVGLDTDQLHTDLRAIDATAEPVVLPVVADVDQVHATIAAVDATVDPVVVPVHANLASAQTEITAFGETLDRQITPHAEQAGDKAGHAFGARFSSVATGIAATAAITIGGVLATSLVEGFQRFTTIQDSTASLTVALQSASEAGEVLADVLKVVRGTPFRLDDFARAATNMIAFGIAAQKVPLYLTAIGEAAATRGSQAEQFAQSLSTIYGQIQAIGRINGEDVWQFGNVGVDVLRILGNTVGKTTEDVRKMISEGAITSEFALDAITNGILHGTEGINGATVAFSGTMEKLGDTLSGSIENFGAARARFGVAIIEPISDTMIAGFKSFTAVLDDFTARIKPIFQGLATSPLIEGLNDFFEKAPSLIQPTIDAFEKLGPALAPIGIAVGALGLGALGAVLGPFGTLIPGITSLTGALTVFAASAALLTPEIRDALIPALEELGEVGLEIGGTLVEGIGEGIKGVAPVVVRALGVLKDIGPEVQSLFAQAFGSIGELGPKITPILDDIVTFAQEALPVAFRAASQGIVALTGFVNAALPVVDKLVLAATDLVPAFSTLLDVTAGVGQVLIPVLETVGELIGDLPVGVLQTLLGVFLGFKAISFFQTQITGISTSVGRLSGSLRTAGRDFQEFRTAGQSNFQALRSEVANLTKSGSTAQTFGVTVAGAFSGMALASEDAATRITGAVGAIGSVMAGFATGGVIGGAFAGIGVGIGLIAQHFIDAKKEAEAFKTSVDELAKSLEGLTEPETVEALSKNLKDTLRTALGDIDIGDLPFLKNLDLAAIVEERLTSGAVSVQSVIDQIFGNLKIDPTTFDQTFAGIQAKAKEFNVSTTGMFKDLGDTINDLKATQSARDFTFGDTDPLKQDLIDLISGLESIQTQLEAAGIDGDAFGIILNEITNKTSGFNKAVAEADVTGSWNTITAAVEETAAAVTDTGESAEDALATWKAALLEDGITMDELREKAKLLGAENETAADKASAAWERFGSVLDSVKAKMDLTVQTQNLAQDMRDLGDTLDKVINTDDIKKASEVGGNIKEVEKRIAELKGRLADETAQGDIIRADLDRRIAFAAARGFEETVAALQAQRDESFSDAQKVQRDIDEQIAKIADLRGQLDGLVTTPITLFQKLTEQAAEANMSMFEFLLAAPTPEAQQVFQDNLVSSVSDAIEQAKAVGVIQGPLAGQAAAESFRIEFANNLTAQFGPETAAQLINNLWPETLIQAGAEEAASTAVEKFKEQIDADMAAEPGTIDLNVEIADLTEQRAELDAFIKDHPGIEVPVTLSEFDKSITDLRAKQITDALDLALTEARSQRHLQLAESNRRPGTTVAEAFTTMFPDETELARRAATKLLSDAQDALDESDPVEMKAKIVDVEKTRDEFETMLKTRAIELPANLNIESINLVIDEANKQAMLDAVNAILPPMLGGTLGVEPAAATPLPFNTSGTARAAGDAARRAAAEELRRRLQRGGGAFAEGGIHGFALDAPHTAQIAHGYRLWAEPETGGEAYLPLGMGKRQSAMGVFMKVADIFDLDVQPRGGGFPELAKMFEAADARNANVGTSVRNAMVDAMHAVRRPVTQQDLERNVVVERIEKLVIGPGETSRKRASEFIREMRLRAARL